MTQLSRTLTLALGASLFALAAPAHADPARVIFTTADLATLQPGTPVHLGGGTTQIRLGNGATASFIGSADFTLTPDGGLDLQSGQVTILNPALTPLSITLPGGAAGTIGPRGAAGFTADAGGGHGAVLAGVVMFGDPNRPHRFSAGNFIAVVNGHASLRGSGLALATNDRHGGLVLRHAATRQWLESGFPAALAQALAAAGANAEVIAAASHVQAFTANPTLDAFPTGDYNLLASYAARIASLNRGPAFNGAQADIITAYFQYLASGRSGSSFLTAYSQMLLSYLDLVRSGALPSSFSGASQSQLSAWIAFAGRTGKLGGLSADNRTLLNAYLAFLRGGGSADAFAPTLARLTSAYLDYLRAGNDPAGFTQLTQSVLVQWLTIVQSGGIKGQITAQNQAFIDAYLASLKANGNGLAFLTTEADALNAYLAFLNGGGLPSQYAALDQATLRAYLAQLINSGLLNLRLGSNAAFLQSYYSYLQGGGAADQYGQLPINLWTSYAAALNAYYAYLAGGGVPSQYGTLTQAQILAYLQALQASGKLADLIGANAGFFSGYYTYLAAGGAPDGYTSLPSGSGSSNGSGSGSGSGSGTMLTAYSGGFPSSGSASFYTSASAKGGFGGGWYSSFKPSLNANGTLAQSGTATASEVAGDALGVIGRYSGGTFTGPDGTGTIPANAGVSYVYMAPFSGSLPTDNTVISYDLIAATKPVYTDGHTAPGGFAASLAFKFGSTLTYRMSGTVTMADATYTFASPGADQGNFSSLQVSSPLNFIVLWPSLSKSGPACVSGNCILDFYGGFAGSTPQNRIGFAYLSNDQSQAVSSYLDGAVMFAAPGSYGAASGGSTSASTSGSGGSGSSSPSTASFGYTVVAGSAGTGSGSGRLARVASGTGLAPLHNLVVNTDNTASNTFFYNRGTATDTDSGATPNAVLGWTRWTGGNVTDNATSATVTLNANEGIAHLWGTPATNLPTTGTATYTMVGGTRPVVDGGSVAPGTLNSASLAVDFATSHVDFGLNLTIDGRTVVVATPNTGQLVNYEIVGGATATGYTPGATTPDLVTYQGFLAGSGGSNAGIGYKIASPALPAITGVIGFRKGP